MMARTTIFEHFFRELSLCLDGFACEHHLPKIDIFADNVANRDNGHALRGDFSLHFVSPKLVLWRHLMALLGETLMKSSAHWSWFGITKFKIVVDMHLIQLFVDRNSGAHNILNSFVVETRDKNFVLICDSTETDNEFVGQRIRLVSNSVSNLLHTSICDMNNGELSDCVYSQHFNNARLNCLFESKDDYHLLLDVKHFLASNYWLKLNSITTDSIIIKRDHKSQLLTIASNLYQIIVSSRNSSGQAIDNDYGVVIVTRECNAYKYKLAIITMCALFNMKASVTLIPVANIMSDCKYDEYLSQLRQKLSDHSDGYIDQNLDSMEILLSTLVSISLLTSHPSCAIKKLKPNPREAIFIQYNCARIYTLIKKYECEFDQNKMSAIKLDLSLLVDDLEWTLIFHHIPNYYLMTESLKQQICDNLGYNLNRVILFLKKFVTDISVYYKKVKVLLEPCDHLLPLIKARIYLCKIIFDILSYCLRLIGVKTIEFM